jgi:hypothetical protein
MSLPVEKKEKIDRTLSDERRTELEKETPILSTTYNKAGSRIRLSIYEEGVLIGKNYFIPFSDIRKVVWLPIETNRPACGGCLVFVTDDCPDLPIRNDHSFHMPDKANGSTFWGLDYNCCFHNCLSVSESSTENAAMEKIKALVESRIGL